MEKTPMGRALMFSQARKGVLSKTKGNYPAQPAAIEVVRSDGRRIRPKNSRLSAHACDGDRGQDIRKARCGRRFQEPDQAFSSSPKA